jgi:two-component system, cell cycle sensor histidine kinase and response regulator CckA
MAGRLDSIDLLITDVVMPKMNGPDLAAHLKRSHPDMIVLYMSGYTDQSLQNQGMIGVGSAFLQKPFLPEALVREANRLLDLAAIS